jgi:hypothetical protein
MSDTIRILGPDRTLADSHVVVLDCHCPHAYECSCVWVPEAGCDCGGCTCGFQARMDDKRIVTGFAAWIEGLEDYLANDVMSAADADDTLTEIEQRRPLLEAAASWYRNKYGLPYNIR